VAGIDSYDQDVSMTSKSLGAMAVLRRNNAIDGEVKNTIIMLIRCRPARKEKFYDMCMMASIYWDLKSNTLIDVRCPGIIQHYKMGGCEMYLAKQPAKFQSERSELKHEYGMSINAYSKPLMIGLYQTYILDHGNKIWYKQILDETLNYDVLEKESDNDSVDAVMLALCQSVSVGIDVIDEGKLMAANPFEYPEYETDRRGNVVPVGIIDREKIKKAKDPEMAFLEMQMLREKLYNLDNDDDDDFK
jgi:hypothetical protein